MGVDEAGRDVSIGLRATLVLGVALAVPFLVDQATSVEPYPAAILPEGGTKVTTRDGLVTYEATTVLGRNASGELVAIDASEFLDPIWVQYLRYMARNEFGLGDLDDPVISVRGTGRTFTIPRHRPSEEQRAEIETWLRERLRAQGLDESGFVVRRVEITAESDSGDTVSTRTKIETTIDL